MEEAEKKQMKKTKEKEKMIEKMIDEQLEQYKDRLSEEEMKMEREALKEVFIKGRPPRHAMGISPEMMNLFYTFGYNSYNAGRFEDAKETFEMLNLLEPLSPRYLLGLAAAHHQLKEWEKAAELYFTLAMIEVESPVPYFHIADCYEQLGNQGGVLMGLTGAISRCGDDPKCAKLKERCYVMMRKCKEKMGIEESEIGPNEEGDGGVFGKLEQEAGKGVDTA